MYHLYAKILLNKSIKENLSLYNKNSIPKLNLAEFVDYSKQQYEHATQKKQNKSLSLPYMQKNIEFFCFE